MGILCEFHPDMLATPLLLAAFYFATIKNWHGYFGMLTLAVTTKETIDLTIILLGFYADGCAQLEAMSEEYR
jgi:uncharacterized membrane protein